VQLHIGYVKDGKNADVAIDHYHRYKVLLMCYIISD